MPKFRVWVEREYTITEGFDREIEAETEDQATDHARDLASQSNMDCPDDVSETNGGGECGSFYIATILPLTETV